VIAGHNSQAPALRQGGEGPLEALPFPAPPPVGHITCHHHVFDVALEQRPAHAGEHVVVRLVVATDVEIRQMRQGSLHLHRRKRKYSKR
jgi:hypothetical protein